MVNLELVPRVIPCLLLQQGILVKTVRFKAPIYIGDPINAVRIFSEKEVDELILLDISATRNGVAPHFGLLSEIVGECFIPVCYGGGIRSLHDAASIFEIGVEKVAVNSFAIEEPTIVKAIAARFGSQSLVVGIDVRRKLFGGYEVVTHGGTKRTGIDPVEHARLMEEMGAGEILLTSIDRDGTMTGYDIELIKVLSDQLTIPVVACGGAGALSHLRSAIRDGGCAAVAAGSLFVLRGRHRAVLINYPERAELQSLFEAEVRLSGH